MRKLLFLVICIVLLPIIELAAQNPYIQHYTTFDGLPANHINGVFQDSRKFIWFATDAGAVRFDGSKFLTFTMKDGLYTSKIIRIKEDSFSRIWITNWDGTMNFYSGNKIYNSANAPFLDSLKPNEPFHDFFQDDDKKIYFYNAMYEVFTLDSNNHVKEIGKIREHFTDNLRYPNGSKITGPYDTTVFESKAEMYFFNPYMIRKTHNGNYLLWSRLSLLRMKELFRDPVLVHAVYNAFMRASCIRDDFFYIIGYGNLIMKYKDEKIVGWFQMPFSIFYTMSRQNSLILDKDGYFWVGTFDDGLYCLQEDGFVQQKKNDKKKTLRIPNIKSTKIIQHLDIRQVNGIIQDHEGNIWVSASAEGVYKISPYLNVHRHYQNDLFENKGIKELAAGLENGVWLSNGRTVYLLKNQNFYTLDFREKNTSFNMICHLKKNKLILGEKYSYFYILHNIKPDPVKKMVKFSRADTSILYMSGITVNQMEDKINCYNYFNFDLIDPDTLFGTYKSGTWSKDFNVGSRIYYTYYNSNDELIVNAKKNYILLNDTCIPVKELSRFDNKIILQHINMNSGTELFNIENEGICLLNNHKFYNLSSAFGIPGDLKIRSISYHEPVLYMANAGNIYKCDNPLKVLNGKPVNLHLVDINYRNIHKILAFNDSLYIASDDGLTVIPEAVIDKITTHTPIPYIQSIMVNDKEADLSGKEMTLRGRNTIKFIFGSINYSSTPVIYSYKLDGADRDWSSGTEKIVVYQNLPKGKYVFKLRIRKPDAKWSQPLEYFIRIRYSVWQHPLFYAALILLLMASVAMIIIRRKNIQIRRREMDHQLVTLEQKALQAMMNPHFIFNSLGSIQNYLLQKKTGEAGLYLSQFARLIRQNLNAIKVAMINLEEETDRLKNYLDLEKMRLRDKFEYRIDIDQSIEPDEIFIPSMLVQPLAENAIWHGITPLEEKGTISIHFQKETESSLKIIVVDDGIGMEKSATYSTKNQDHLHLTLDLNRKRLELLGKKFNIPTRIDFTEAFPGRENPGTRVEMVVPFTYNEAVG